MNKKIDGGAGFKNYRRKTPEKRPVGERLGDFGEIYRALDPADVKRQAARCMECGTPFCHWGCPLGNLAPDFNDAVFHERWREACEILHSRNNFPEFTGRVCPAFCEAACTLGLIDEAVTVRQMELEAIERGFAGGFIRPEPPDARSGRSVAVVGAGPAGLAAAQQLNRAGHNVTVYEKCARPGGLLRYGIPDFKLEKRFIERRIEQLTAEGVAFETGVAVGSDISAAYLKKRFDALLLCIGAEAPRDLAVPGRELGGIHLAVPYLARQNRVLAGEIDTACAISAAGKRVVVIGGGDTGADCIGTALRQGARSVEQIEILPKPPDDRPPDEPWPLYPRIYRRSSSHEEGGSQRFSVTTKSFDGKNGGVVRVNCVEVEWSEPGEDGRRTMSERRGTEFSLEAELVILALGFVGPVKTGPIADLGLALDERGNIRTNENMLTSVGGVFAAGDGRSGPSLAVHAIAAGRKAAREIDIFLTGASVLPTV